GGFIDGVFTRTNVFVAIYQNLTGYIVGYHPFGDNLITKSCSKQNVIPLRVWINESTRENWFEFFPQDSSKKPYVEHFQILYGVDGGASVYSKILPSGPENDPDSFMRIGRIDPPMAITATKDALLKRWNLETGEVTATAQLDGLPAAGQVNADGTSFAWVDQKFASLHLLDFESKVDKLIASLGGTYIPFLLLSAKADVIIGVNVGLEPNVVAWDVVTGERIDLGEYCACNRQPDMVRLSKDGSTLVIGCDTGLDIWRVSETP
ncbi:MAG TPA: hypothetical protein VLK33_14795, partial [Terriglobales bacterium]|nr:hypothetical protein [Terriglobales bacterium]